jgi:hypothetical protein
MRSYVSCKYNFIICLLILIIFSNISVAQGNQLDILITNFYGDDINAIKENEFFKISVLDFEQVGSPYLIDVNIEFNDILFLIGESAELILQAPEVTNDFSFIISAFKEGYNSTNKTIIILNNESNDETLGLLVIPDDFTIKAGERFSVIVIDENGGIVSGVEVAIQSFGEKEITNSNGRAWLIAPEDKEIITIIAQKEGYNKGNVKIGVNLKIPWWQDFFGNPYFPLFVGAIILIFAIIFVNIKQKKSIFNRAGEISKEKKLEEDKSKLKKEIPGSNSIFSTMDNIRVKPNHDSKVEEIRITRPRKEKEVIPVSSEKNETEKLINKKKIQKKDYDWFKGTDDIRYEIDKITGEIDEDGIDKWYEGVDDIREKIDEKMKKRKEKNREDNNDNQ